MRVMLPHKLAEHIPEDYVPPQKLIADVGKMVSDARDAGLLRMTGGAAPNLPTARGHLDQIGKRAALIPRHMPMCFHVISPVPVRTYSVVRKREAISGSRSSLTGPGREETPRALVTSCFPLQLLIAYRRSGQTRGSYSQSQR